MAKTGVFMRLRLVLQELCVGLAYRPIPRSVKGEVALRAFRLKDTASVRQLFFGLNPQGSFSVLKLMLGLVAFRKLLIIAEDVRTRQLVGLDLFYFNDRDLRERTVHEGFIGVVPAYQGQGLATAMRELAKLHFRSNGLSGISTRITQDNVASLQSALKLGFEVVDGVFDASAGYEKYYLVCPLEGSK